MQHILIKLLNQEEIKFTPRRADMRNAARMSVIWTVLTNLYKLRDLTDKYISDVRQWFEDGGIAEELGRFDAERKSKQG